MKKDLKYKKIKSRFNNDEITNELLSNESKWQKKWEETKIFEAEVEKDKKKYTINTPYPYMNGILHVGHLYTFMFPEIIARYKRMQGFNVQFSFGFQTYYFSINYYSKTNLRHMNK